MIVCLADYQCGLNKGHKSEKSEKSDKKDKKDKKKLTYKYLMLPNALTNFLFMKLPMTHMIPV